MKVILLNNNPAVSKLVSVSLNKLGYTFAEIDNLEYLTSNDADLIICDSGLYDSKINYLEYAKNQLFLIPRNRADEYNLAKSQTLQKPFLPTDFIDVVKRILVEIPKSTKIVEPKPSDIKVGDEFGHTNDNIDVFIMPSLQEGLPRSMVEAMSRGCNVIGSRVGGIPELLDDNFHIMRSINLSC